MTRQRYSKKEAINRILRSFQASPILSDQPNSLSGEILSEDEAFSDLAELLQDSLPGETPFIPDAMSHRYGGIYSETATGTSQSLITGTWATLAGFTADGYSSDGITPDYANNRLILNKVGTYFCAFNVSLEAPAGTATTYHMEVSVDGVRQDRVSSKRGLGTSGAIVGSMGANGPIQVSSVPASGTYVDIQVLTQDANRVLHIHEAQLTVIKLS